MRGRRSRRRILLAVAVAAAFATTGAGLAYAGSPAGSDGSAERSSEAGFEWRREAWPGVPNNNFRAFVRSGDALLAAPRPNYVNGFTGSIYWAGSPAEPWTLVTKGRATDDESDLWASGPDDVYQTDSQEIHHFDGTAWTSSPFEGGFSSAVWGSGPQNVYVGGGRFVDNVSTDIGRLVRGSADGWVEERYDAAKQQPYIVDIWGSGPDDIYLATHADPDSPRNSGIYHKVDGEWDKELSGYDIEKLVGTGPDDVWAIGTPEQNPFRQSFLHSTGDGNWVEVARADDAYTVEDIAAAGRGELLYTDVGINRLTASGEQHVLTNFACGAIGTWSANEVVSRCPKYRPDNTKPGLVRGSR